jgi:hypothetical protein
MERASPEKLYKAMEKPQPGMERYNAHNNTVGPTQENMSKRASSIGDNEDRKLAFSFGALILAIMLIVTITGMYLYTYQQIKEETRLSAALAGVLSESISKVNFSGKYHTAFLSKILNRELQYLNLFLLRLLTE